MISTAGEFLRPLYIRVPIIKLCKVLLLVVQPLAFAQTQCHAMHTMQKRGTFNPMGLFGIIRGMLQSHYTLTCNTVVRHFAEIVCMELLEELNWCVLLAHPCVICAE